MQIYQVTRSTFVLKIRNNVLTNLLRGFAATNQEVELVSNRAKHTIAVHRDIHDLTFVAAGRRGRNRIGGCFSTLTNKQENIQAPSAETYFTK